MAGFNPEDGKIYLINPNDFDANEMITLKLNKPKNNQIIGINLAENYLLR